MKQYLYVRILTPGTKILRYKFENEGCVNFWGLNNTLYLGININFKQAKITQTMGTWNTAINGNDTFLDIYQRFFQLYNEGRNPFEISGELFEVFEGDLNDVDT